MFRTAILGASGQISKGLISELSPFHELYLFSREPKSVHAFLERMGIEGKVYSYGDFPRFHYDVVINATGPGDPRTIRENTSEVLRVTEFFDNLVLDYLVENPGTLYIFLSSGAIYRNGYQRRAGRDATCEIPLNHFSEDLIYPLAKICAEVKHRSLARFKIADVRIFGYFSRYIDLSGGFFLSQAGQALVSGERFRTPRTNFVRDYVCADELARLLDCILESDGWNAAYDLVSAAPVSKARLLERMIELFDLEVEIEGSGTWEFEAIEEPKSLGYDGTTRAIDYAPRFTSMEIVEREMRSIIEAHDRDSRRAGKRARRR